MGLLVFGFALIILKLFYLQIIRHNYYITIAQKEHQGYAELPARRGEILITDYHSGEEYKLATNTTLDLVYADPSLVKNPQLVAEKLAPIIFNLEDERTLEEKRIQNAQREALKLTQEIEKRKEASEALTVEVSKPATEGISPSSEIETVPPTGEIVEVPPPPPPPTSVEVFNSIQVETPLIPKTDEELFNQYKFELAKQLSEKIRTQILLIQEIDPELKAHIEKLHLEGIEISENGDLIAYPPLITDREKVANKLSDLIGFEEDYLARLLQGRNRYTILKKGLSLEDSEKIKILQEEDTENFIGIRLQEEYYRYYPEGSLASQILGYVNSANLGQYGIEGRFQKLLEGEKGFFTSQRDGTGNQITVGESLIQPAKDGQNVFLTIDRAIQLEAEKAIEEGVKTSQSDAGQVIIMDPKTGKILAIAQYPTFNPNAYGQAFAKKEIKLTDDQIKNLYTVGEGEDKLYYFYLRKDPDERIQVFPDPEIEKLWYMYENRVGPEVYKNKVVQEIYEPGSVFKVLAMASAIDAGEVEPTTRHSCNGAVKVDEFEIHTFNDQYHGSETMTQVLEHSCNIGMVVVARTLGSNLFYNYIKKFGFGIRTDIELDNEENGFIEYFSDWSESELATHGFGQGISTTPLQMITAVSALANNGMLMKPHIIEKIVDTQTGDIQVTEPKAIEQVISPESAKTITSMMISTVENGYPNVKLPKYYLAGKSGTAQTYKFGKALKGIGTTIGSFAAFAPVNDPQFVILVKMDHAKASPWGNVNAGPVAKRMMEFMFKYYNIPPDKS